MPKRISKQAFLERASKVPMSSMDDLSKIEYVSMSKKAAMFCKTHGIYSCRPSDYLNGHRCPKCSNVAHGSNESFIEKAMKAHCGKYSYSKVLYTSSKTKVIITCPTHGDFEQRPNDHLNGYGCPMCAKRGSSLNGRLTTEEFIERARRIHGNRYDYSKVSYSNAKEKVIITCSIHGDFIQVPNNHLNGANCPKCSKVVQTSRMAMGVYEMLAENGFEVEAEKTFAWLRNERSLRLDFYLPRYNVGIEVQGEQHFVSVPRFNGDDGLLYRKYLDALKKKLCDEHGVRLFYITKSNYSIDEILQYVNGYGEKEEDSKKA